MNHETIQELIPAYAVGAADAEERAVVEAHTIKCTRCRALLAEYQLLAEELLYTVPRAQAPSRLEAELRRRIGHPSTDPRPQWTGEERRWRRQLGWAVIGLALLALIVSNGYWATRVRTVEERAAVQATALVALAEAPRAELHGDAIAPEARGMLYYRPDSHIGVLHVYGMPPLPEGKVYQLWLIRGGHRESGGLFAVNEEGEGVLLIEATRPLGEYEAVGVTMEPEGGSAGPTSPRVIGGEL